ncbi:MAG: GGDEF domain-containing protein [Gammaproteobacteria bacterium]|nr:GGDEF domain-containing protein [Gammaproteobacteria bacterium]
MIDAPEKNNNDSAEAGLGLGEWLRQVDFSDLAGSSIHSQDFSGSRAEFISLRVRLFSLVFAVLAVLWVPVDMMTVPPESLGTMLVLRGIYAGAYFLLGSIGHGMQSLVWAQIRLAVFVIVACLFYGFSRIELSSSASYEGILVGYSFLPYLTIAFLAIFPLTFFEGLRHAALVLVTFVGTELLFGGSLTLSRLGDIWLLLLLAGIAAWTQLSQLQMLLRLYREASHDALTGLANRRVLNKWLAMEIPKARQQARPLSVLLFDLDHFKRINDTWGHLVGDRVLKTFARLLRRDLSSSSSFISRYGGEEFLVVLPGCEEPRARMLAEKIRQNCDSLKIMASSSRQFGVTVSIGVASLGKQDTADSLMSRADDALYAAKSGGRNQVVLATAAVG